MDFAFSRRPNKHRRRTLLAEGVHMKPCGEIRPTAGTAPSNLVLPTAGYCVKPIILEEGFRGLDSLHASVADSFECELAHLRRVPSRDRHGAV